MAQAEVNYQVSDEVDENGRPFVLSSKGVVEFGNIGEDTGLTPAPILLSEGMITNPNTKDGYGLVHIEAKHGEQIRSAGYTSVIDFIEEVGNNYEIIREGKNRNGEQTYLLQLTDKHDNTLIVELSGDGTYYNINTAGIFKHSYGAKKNIVYNRHTTEGQSAETDGLSQDWEQNGTPKSSRMVKPTTNSAGKDTKISETEQEKVANAIESASSEVDTNPSEAQKNAEETVGFDNPVAAEYLFESGVGVIKSAGYLLRGIGFEFSKAREALQLQQKDAKQQRAFKKMALLAQAMQEAEMPSQGKVIWRRQK